MAASANAVLTYAVGAAGGNRESLADKLWMVEQQDTPILSAIGSTSATAVTHEWMNDSIEAVNKNNASLEGDNITPAASSAPTRKQNICQIFTKSWEVSGTQEAVKKAGRKSEVNRIKVNKAIALRRDMEAILFGEQGQALGASDTARKARGFESFIETNVSRGETGANAANATSAPTDGTPRAFTEALLKPVLQSMFNTGAKPRNAYVGAFNKQQFSTFTGRANARQNVSAGTVEAAVDVYASDFGDLKVIPSPHHRARTALLIDPSYVKVAHLRKMHEKELARTGDADKGYYLCEGTLEVNNERAHGVIADLTVA